MTVDNLTPKLDRLGIDRKENFVLDLKGFEGPLHLLLTLSRSQKVDLRQISLVDLCDQYLIFISEVKKLKIEMAADYLIMASWLVFLKSELLLPKEELENETNALDLAQNLKFQLIRLDAIRNASIKLMASDQLNRDFFKRGESDNFKESKEFVYTASLLDVLQAYAGMKTKEEFKPLHLKNSLVFLPEQAQEILNKKLKSFFEWYKFGQLIPDFWKKKPERRRSAVATSFAVCLEQARLKKIEIKQVEMFAPLYVRKSGSIKNEMS